MKNRNSSSPILLAAALSFVVTPALLSQAEPGVPSENTASNTVATPPAPAAVTPQQPIPPPSPAPAALNDVTAPAPITAADRPATYTVVTGDSLWLIAQKFNCSVTALKKANNLTKKNLKPGQVLKIPPARGTKAASPAKSATAPAAKPTTSISPTKSTHHAKDTGKAFAHAQPVQDFDIPASTFASCPVPEVTGDTDVETPTTAPVKTARTAITPPAPNDPTAAIAQPVSAAELASIPVTDAPQGTAPSGLANSSSTFSSSTLTFSRHSSKFSSDDSPAHSNAPSGFASSSTKQMAAPRGQNPLISTPSNDWSTRFLTEARNLGNQNIDYDESWRPPGEAHVWAMDCSNTSRYLYKVTTGIQLPRTASDQYYYLHLQDKAWDVPTTSSGFADCNYLKENLKPGDLLFWENTYRPERQPPITHVMVFLGTNEKGQWIMAGSQTSRGGEHNRRNGGPDIYVFDPTKPCGGYTTWLGLVHHQGRFCAYGRPLDADRSKLAVAAND